MESHRQNEKFARQYHRDHPWHAVTAHASAISGRSGAASPGPGYTIFNSRKAERTRSTSQGKTTHPRTTILHELTHMPHIARWVKPDVVVSAAGCRIDEHLEQSSAQASSEPVIPVRPEVAPRGYVDRYITLSDW